MGKEINHIELNSKDLTETKKFYAKLFGWKFQFSGDDYAMFRTSKKGLGGGFQLAKKVTPGTTRFYVSVETIPKTQQKAVSLGGKVGQRKKAIGGGMGYWGTIKDPHGNVIGLHSQR
jgi:predicted enzyme related to lactoylglutathione lyase